MGQRHSGILLRPTLSFIWILRCERLVTQGRRQRAFTESAGMDCKRGDYKRKSARNGQTGKSGKNDAVEINDGSYSSAADCPRRKIVYDFGKHSTGRNDFAAADYREKFSHERAKQPTKATAGTVREVTVKRTLSEPTLDSRGAAANYVAEADRGKHRARRTRRIRKTLTSDNGSNGCNCGDNTFGYAIADLDAFLTKASIENPANIPVVLSFPSVLYQTRGGIQNEMSLPLGTVVNAVFKNQAWLYVQTPHGHEGYVGCSSCLPLGILPHAEKGGPCWEDPTDVFPRPLGNTRDPSDEADVRDTKSENGCYRRAARTARCAAGNRRGYNHAVSTCNDAGERNVDHLYLKAAASGAIEDSLRSTLTVHTDFLTYDKQFLTVSKEDKAVTIHDRVPGDWLWVYTRNGREGFIPATIV